MPEYNPDELESRLASHLGELSGHPVNDINSALHVAGLLEARNFTFQLKDMCPKSLDCLWRAAFTADGREFAAEAPQSPVAICSAALAALEKSNPS